MPHIIVIVNSCNNVEINEKMSAEVEEATNAEEIS
jgi:hypothetical protein